MKFRTHSYATWVNGTWTILKAYLKENAIARFQQLDSSVQANDVVITANHLTAGSNPVDEIIEDCDFQGNCTYSITFRF